MINLLGIFSCWFFWAFWVSLAWRTKPKYRRICICLASKTPYIWTKRFRRYRSSIWIRRYHSQMSYTGLVSIIVQRSLSTLFISLFALFMAQVWESCSFFSFRSWSRYNYHDDECASKFTVWLFKHYINIVRSSNYHNEP